MIGTRKTLRLITVMLALSMLVIGPSSGIAAPEKGASTDASAHRAQVLKVMEQRQLHDDRLAAAARLKLQKQLVENRKGISRSIAATAPVPGGVPDYFDGTPNWAFSPELRKFVDELPGVGVDASNTIGQYIPLGHPDTLTYPGSDYYEIELREYDEQMHSDLPPTRLRGYVQVNKGTAGASNTVEPDPIHYLGPVIVARKDRPVRVKFTNKLPTGDAGDLFLPVDKTSMGAGFGPLGSNVPSGTDPYYSENRGTIHLHGGRTVWISDGTPHQWITPAGENTAYPKGVSVRNVPDMPDPGPGSMTFFYSNQQSARMMFYHDHTQGMTRLNVYAGGAGGYFIKDDSEDRLVNAGVLPTDELPLIVQDKTFVDASTIASTDPTWNWGTGAKDVNGWRTPMTGDLWFPHVYMPAQNPADMSGMNTAGRWHYGPWFWPPTKNIDFPPIPNPYYDPVNAPWEPATMPAMPNPSATGEAWFDTAVVNGTAYPTVEIEPKAYRVRVLNAANDRFWNLQMYVADSDVITSDGRVNTEVKMVPASNTTTYFPEDWPVDGREGGVPDPRTAGPDWIQIGTEGGFLPKPAIVPQQPITWLMDPAAFAFGTVDKHSLLLGPAERADTIVDFSDYRGKTLIVYNDAPAPFPALDPRLDYYTNSPDLSDVGGYWGTRPGFGPNTRTIMQIKVKDVAAAPTYDLAALEAEFASSDTTAGVFASSQHPILVPDARYDTAYNASFTPDPYVRIYQNEMTFKTLAGTVVTMALEPKAIQDEMGEAFDTQYGRMSGKLGLEMPFTNAGNANFMLYSFFDPPTEIVKDTMTPLSPVLGDGTQIWKITQNGVDTHPMHFHLFEVQVINRVGWDNWVYPPDDNELGWKDTVRVNPLMDTIVALRPVAPKSPFGVPESVRPLDPNMPLGSTEGFSNLDPETGQAFETPVTNQLYNFGWEYVWHCHILSHEEMDMMRPIVFRYVSTKAILSSLVATGYPGGPVTLDWVDGTPGDAPSTWGNSANEIGFRIERAVVAANGSVGPYTAVGQALANVTSYVDTSTVVGVSYRYRVVAFNAQGDTLSNVVLVAPPAPTPTGLVGTLQDGPRVRLTFTDNSTNETGFLIERSMNGGGFSTLTTMAAQAGTGSRTYLDTTVTSGNTYAYRVKAVVGAGATGFSNTVTVNVRFIARISGTDRYVVALNMAKNAWGATFPGTTDLVVASGEDAAQADILSASGLAGVWGAPLLTVPQASLRTDISNTIAAMPAGLKVHIVGGTASVSSAVQTQIDALPNVASVDRISGADRYAVAANVATRMKTQLGSSMPTTTIIVNGNLPGSVFDALTASPISWKNKFPVLLVTDTSVPAATTAALTSIGLTNRYIIGGTASVSEGVRTTLGIPTSKRISGSDRYTTAAAAASRAKSMGWLANTYFGFSSTVPDAATGGAYMGKRNGSLLYVTSTSVPSGTSSFLSANKAGVTGGYVFGGTTSIPESVRLRLLSFMQ